MADLSKTYPSEFYSRPTLSVAKDLLGALLCRRLPNGTIETAPIVEVEAYTMDDPACHASKGLTPRCEVMFGPPGRAYVYFIYGMYHCLNVVTEPDGTAGAVLIRAIGIPGGDGPGKLCRTWNINRSHNGLDLCDPTAELWISPGQALRKQDIGESIRVGISVAQERQWRFFIKSHPQISVKTVKPHVRKKKRATANE